MDGLTIKEGNALLNTGKTLGEIRSERNTPAPTGVGTLEPGAKSFADTLKDAVSKVNDMQKEADRKMEALATGKSDNIQEVMIAAEKADIGLRLLVQMRNKVIDAYQEIMKMQV